MWCTVCCCTSSLTLSPLLSPLSFGAALRVAHSLRCVEEGRFVPFAEVSQGAFRRTRAASPDMAAHVMYTDMLVVYAEAERRLVAGEYKP